ncbi:MAG: entericidin A/B family lipoprotein [Akkermansiaceae bacterium]|nr:entericidin A/B family lipoprotein [Akkermansiaceae bacterium]
MIPLAAGTLAMSSCNTFIGMGKDIQSLGSGMQNTAYKKSATAPPPVQEAVPAPQPAQ